MLQIPLERIIRKMEAELHQLSTEANEKAVREHVLIIRSLCDLLLEEQEQPQSRLVPTKEHILPVVQSQSLPTYVGNEESGGSLLDF